MVCYFISFACMKHFISIIGLYPGLFVAVGSMLAMKVVARELDGLPVAIFKHLKQAPVPLLVLAILMKLVIFSRNDKASAVTTQDLHRRRYQSE
jgi:hypothetical protein